MTLKKINPDFLKHLIDDWLVQMEMGRAEPIGRTSADINHRNLIIKRERGVTRGHPKRSPILVLLSLKCT